MGNGRRVRRHVATEKVNPNEALPMNKPVVSTVITSYAVALDEHMKDLSVSPGASAAPQVNAEPGIKFELVVTIAHKKYDVSILPSHDEIQECIAALFRRTIEKRIKTQHKKK